MICRFNALMDPSLPENSSEKNVVLPSSLSDLRLICCASGRNGPFWPVFSLHRPAMRLENGPIRSRFPTRLATIAQVRQAARGGDAAPPKAATLRAAIPSRGRLVRCLGGVMGIAAAHLVAIFFDPALDVIAIV